MVMEYSIVAAFKKVNETEVHIKETGAIDDLPLPNSTKNITRNPPVPHTGLVGISSRDEYQYYVIGVYSFFAFLFAIGLFMLLARKLKEACCRLTENEHPDFESYSHRDSTCSRDNLGFESPQDAEDAERTYPGYDSDYDYYSDASNDETKSLKDKPPDYEEPPSYLVASQTLSLSINGNYEES